MSARISLTDRLEQACQMYWGGKLLSDVMAWGYAHWPPNRDWRYVRTSKPVPHEFDGYDAKAVFRRLRRGKPVSRALIQRAANALWKEAYQNGLSDSE